MSVAMQAVTETYSVTPFSALKTIGTAARISRANPAEIRENRPNRFVVTIIWLKKG
jgi:hypothetical protein